MIVGAATGFAAAYLTDSTLVGVAAGILGGVVLSGVFAFLTLGLAANQVASGLALTILGRGVAYWLMRTRAGLTLRAVGDNHSSGHSLGVPVRSIRLLAVLFGGGCAGLAGSYLSLAYTPFWSPDMTAGRGWISLALVVFASWKPWRAYAGALLFGGVTVLQLVFQTWGVPIPPQFLSSLPYLTTIAVLVILSIRDMRGASAPASLGVAFIPDR